MGKPDILLIHFFEIGFPVFRKTHNWVSTFTFWLGEFLTGQQLLFLQVRIFCFEFELRFSGGFCVLVGRIFGQGFWK
jgi:hypothetical protein